MQRSNEAQETVRVAEIPRSGGITLSGNKPYLQNKSPPGRGGSSGVYANGKLIVFGGHFFEGNDKFEYLNETWLLDVEKLLWHPVNCSGELPGPRYGHTAHVLGSRMYIFGGKGPGDAVYKDVYFLDLLEWVWVPVNTISTSPPPRFFHASEVVGRKIVIHGGWDCNDTFNDLWIFNTDSFVWSQPKTSGFGPTPRYGHSLTLTPDGRLVAIGGCSFKADSGVPKYENDVRQLDTNTMIWTRPHIGGPAPTGRYGHSSTLLENGKVLLYGGWGKGGCQSSDLIEDNSAHTSAVLDTSTMEWYVPRRLGHKPIKHLYNHATCRCGPSAIYIFGGFDGRQALGDFYVINIDLENTTY